MTSTSRRRHASGNPSQGVTCAPASHPGLPTVNRKPSPETTGPGAMQHLAKAYASSREGQETGRSQPKVPTQQTLKGVTLTVSPEKALSQEGTLRTRLQQTVGTSFWPGQLCLVHEARGHSDTHHPAQDVSTHEESCQDCTDLRLPLPPQTPGRPLPLLQSSGMVQKQASQAVWDR